MLYVQNMQLYEWTGDEIEDLNISTSRFKSQEYKINKIESWTARVSLDRASTYLKMNPSLPN